MHFVHNIFVLLFILLLVVGCRSSRSGTSRSDIETDHLKETRKDSIDFNAKFAATCMSKNLTSRPDRGVLPSGTWWHGFTRFGQISNRYWSIFQKQVRFHNQSETDYCQFRYYLGAIPWMVEAETIYQVKSPPWYEPFIPYLVLTFLATIIYYFRRKE